MPLADICALDVAASAAENCVLYLWTPPPMATTACRGVSDD